MFTTKINADRRGGGYKFFQLPHNARFSNKMILAFLLPVFIEQLTVTGMGIADTYMLAFLGDTVVAGISLAGSVNLLIKQFLLALAAGGCVVLSQYIGAGDMKNAKIALKLNIGFVVLMGCAAAVLIECFKTPILAFLFHDADPEVLENSRIYLTVLALSYPSVALYNVTTAAYRAMGNSRIPFAAALAMMSIDLMFKYLFIFKLDMGVIGSGLATFTAMTSVSIILLVSLRKGNVPVRLVGLLKSDFDRNIFKSIISVSMPNGVENTLFQIGTVVISVLVSSLGTVTITANSVAGNVTPLILSLGLAFNTVIMVLVGQCMGAGEPDEAEMYIKHTLKLDYFLTFINGIIFMVVLLPMISVFHVSPEAKNLAAKVLAMYACFSVLFYPSGFALPSALRGSGDTKFVMAASIASMFIFRIGAAYFFVRVMNMGLIGTWLAMGLDWIIRTVIFTVRFLQRKWKENKII